jgi:2-polyprenyl-3-methyl-5-hydroxy-6-metoxy-1,4-benzoquinol methylase
VIPDSHFERFETKKYRSKNPLQRALIKRFGRALTDLFDAAAPAKTVFEIGVGEGFLSGYLSGRYPEKSFAGIDLNPEDVRRLKSKFPAIDAHVGSAYDLSAWRKPEGYDLVICAEVLEHLDRPEDAIREILALSPKRVILSVPHEPFFMLSNLLRGKNITRLGNDIEHINHWGRRSFRALLERHFEVKELTTSYPWILSLLAPRTRPTP